MNSRKPESAPNLFAFSSSDPGFSSEAISDVLMPVRYSFLDGVTRFEHSVEIVRVGELHFWNEWSSSGFAFRAEQTPDKRFELHFIDAGQCTSTTNCETVAASAGQAYLLRNYKAHHTVWSPQSKQVVVSIQEARLSRLIADEFSILSADLTALRSVVDCNEIKIQRLRQLATLLVTSGSEERQGEVSIGTHLLIEAFLALFIECWPTDNARSHQHVARPYYIKRAIAWMNARALQRITLEDLSSAAGASVRTLQLGFRKYLGVSPMAYLFAIRLERAHKDLLTEAPSVTVDEIARRWGFSNPGKFAAHIRLRYGQNPLAIRKAALPRK
ncbi:AraC-binding-like domain-containing protein [Rhizobium mongolense subsp. loessense]|uniref:Transcriptional regulator, AraC family n=2 Tax=Rhizobium TaxID=379 RepID=A0A1C3X4Z4_9HYPH|nr:MULTISPECIES: helix-turn-helix transcriptional regulator [Rhizobium]NRP90567.1 Regulatory protein PchR [Ensifer adhaerens]SCB47323.1 transcriptional regulator, AraC family [Rhizobium multihospitium]SCW84107.1 AraC-binding-like domain-containing protein [Rhizobium mongolense subsp. loessense]